MNGVEAYEAASYPTPSPPVPTTPGILQEDAYEWARRNLVSRAMALEPIGDIADVSLGTGGGTQETLTWETATDWDNAVSETGVVHESSANSDHGDATTVKKGYSVASPLASASLEAYHPLHEDSGTTATDVANAHDGTYDGGTLGQTGLLGTTAPDFDGSDDRVTLPTGILGASTDFSVSFWHNPDTVTGEATHLLDFRGDVNFIIRLGNSGDAYAVWDGNSYKNTTATATANAWNHVVYTWDDSAGSGTFYQNASSESMSTSGHAAGGGGSRYMSSASDRHVDGGSTEWRIYTGLLSSSQVQTLYDTVNGESSLTTATKSFSGAGKPDLQNLVYSLNGESITLDVIGSPGTGSEETVSQVLDGTSSFSLTWSNSHTDFRIKPRLSTSDPTTTPTFGKGELVATV